MKKIYVNVVVPSLDRSFDIEIPINLEMKYVVDELQKAFKDLSNGAYVINDNLKLYDKSTGFLINTHNIVKFSGLTNGCSILVL